MRIKALILLAFTLSAVADSTSTDGLTIHTQQGDVAGTLVSPRVRRFLGIPYAVTGRWEAPQSPPLRNVTFNASKFGDSCIQMFSVDNLEFLKLAGFSNDTITVPESEDCLSVNIWTPDVSRQQKTAVMIWVYGGSSQFGTSNFPIYSGQNIVEDNNDVLVVSFNYRLNIFGQPNAPQLINTSQSQNFGLLDLDAAVKWVHDNIAAFGGDPDRIVLFGESAGGIALDLYTYAHPQDTIVKGVIEQSGNLGSFTTSNINSSGWNVVADAVGCGNAATDAQLSCMKGVPFRKLEDAVVSKNVILGSFSDNITVFSDTVARAAVGNFLHVPLLLGTTAQEADIAVVSLEELTLGFTIPVIPGLLSDAITQIAFTCPTGKTAIDRVKAGVPVWRYQYQAVFPNISPRPDLRAYHSSEIAIVFGTYNKSSATEAETALSSYVQGAWVAFARDPIHGLTNYGWPTYDPATNSLIEIGGPSNQTGAVFSQGLLLDLACAVTDELLSLIANLSALLTGAANP